MSNATHWCHWSDCQTSLNSIIKVVILNTKFSAIRTAFLLLNAHHTLHIWCFIHKICQLDLPPISNQTSLTTWAPDWRFCCHVQIGNSSFDEFRSFCSFISHSNSKKYIRIHLHVTKSKFYELNLQVLSSGHNDIVSFITNK